VPHVLLLQLQSNNPQMITRDFHVDHPLLALMDGCGAYYLIMVWFGIYAILDMDDGSRPPRG
jgi:hypothetical protein